jgi:hypothetical protein
LQRSKTRVSPQKCCEAALRQHGTHRPSLRVPPLQLTVLQKAVQQTAAQGSEGGGLTPLESLRSSAAGSLAAPAADRSAQAASQHGGLTRAADCFRCAAPRRLQQRWLSTRQHAAVPGAACGRQRARGCCLPQRLCASGPPTAAAPLPCCSCRRREGVLLLDSDSPGWTVLYTNDAFSAVSGVARRDAVSRGFWDLFGAPGQGPATFQAGSSAGWKEGGRVGEVGGCPPVLHLHFHISHPLSSPTAALP